jgi:hypothetical protein
MKNHSTIFVVILIVFSAGLFSNCSDNPTYRDYLIKVDSIKTPISITAGNAFQIEFFGTISPSGCAVFSHFTTIQSGSEIIIEAWKTVEVDPVTCPTVMVYLDGELLDYTLANQGNYIIKIKQPDNTFLIESITVN